MNFFITIAYLAWGLITFHAVIVFDVDAKLKILAVLGYLVLAVPEFYRILEAYELWVFKKNESRKWTVRVYDPPRNNWRSNG